VPHIVNIRVEGDRPAEDCDIELPLIDELLDESRPFDDADIGLDPNVGKATLDDLCRLFPDLVSLIGDDFEREGLSVLFQEPVSVTVGPAGFGKKLPGLGWVVGVSPDMGVVGPGAGFVRSRRLLP